MHLLFGHPVFGTLLYLQGKLVGKQLRNSEHLNAGHGRFILRWSDFTRMPSRNGGLNTVPSIQMVIILLSRNHSLVFLQTRRHVETIRLAQYPNGFYDKLLALKAFKNQVSYAKPLM